MKFKVNNWNKLQDSSTPKLLIIGCANSKSPHHGHVEVNYVNCDFGENILATRNQRMVYYRALLNNPNHDNYFTVPREGVNVAANYFQNTLNENYYQALNLYGSNYSPFYNEAIKALYREKIADHNLHLLIISGLYGLLKYDDCINDYHLKINKGPQNWGNSILLGVENYIHQNNIDNDSVFYSLSNNYLETLNPVHMDWTNLWRNYGGRGRQQASDLIEFLNNL